MANSTALDYTYLYPFASRVAPRDSGLGLDLATCDLRREHPHFFDGKLRHPRETAQMLLGLALFAPQGDLSRTAIDVLVETIADGRARPDLFGEPLPRVCATKWFQPGRMAGYLKDVAQVSPLHTWVVAGMVQPVIASWSELPKNGHHLLELLLESLAQLGQPLEDGAAKALGDMKCSGKSAKLVKQLLALEGKDTGIMVEVLQLALAAQAAREMVGEG